MRLSLPEDAERQAFTPQQRLLLLDTWRRSGLPAKDFSALVGISKHTSEAGSGFKYFYSKTSGFVRLCLRSHDLRCDSWAMRLRSK